MAEAASQLADKGALAMPHLQDAFTDELVQGLAQGWDD